MTIPGHWRRTQRKPVVIDGHEFLSYRTGINAYTLHCEALNARVYRNAGLTSYHVSVGGKAILSPRTGEPHRFRREHDALIAAIRLALP